MAETEVSRSAARRLIRLNNSRGKLSVIFRFSCTANTVTRECVIPGSYFLALQRQHRSMPDMQDEYRDVDDGEKDAIGSPVAASVEQFTDGFFKRGALGRKVRAFGVF